LHTSFTYDTRDDNQLKLVYNFIIQQVVATINLSSTTTPIRGTAKEKQKAVLGFERESFWGVFDPPPVVLDDDDELVDNPSMDLLEFMQLQASRGGDKAKQKFLIDYFPNRLLFAALRRTLSPT